MKNSSLLLTLTIVMGVLSLIGFMGHIVFKIAHWPGTGMFRIIGLGGAILGFGAYFLYKKQFQQEKDHPPVERAKREPETVKKEKPAKHSPATSDLPEYGDLWEKDDQ